MLRQGNVVYLDLHKTGSSFIARFLRKELLAPVDHWAKHQPPRRSSKRPGEVWLMSVRNPLDYYVSLWSFGREKRKWLYTAFDESVRDSLYGEGDHATFQRWIRHLFDAEGLVAKPENANGYSLPEQIRYANRCGVGLFTLRWLVLATSSPRVPRPEKEVTRSTDVGRFFERRNRVDVFVRLEHLNDDLREFALRPGVELREGALERLAAAAPANPSSHDKAAAYFDDSTRDLVLRGDKAVFRRHYPGVLERLTRVVASGDST